ncbi:MAG: YqeG family HAD IIIA-type phosphatase [Candidatus Izemoplasmatales bacterium]|jgi:hypothetical protein|nr:YqeG family HAD IIIA-type phosphatase [Candidatus Izemoplasmatales bacterium]MDD5601497.1 YqeG family HAD IIIA-type phosphatase [Candidatus Izemoplasmatales bacterium]MDY0373192.1 YqeG family HAD IIIA-type phosphatase [Candidatus Izemoplasmatales bacterium]NLF49311.1 YqeG family HAD IIIA-type phosphatase [Acholeplasmataceae bacterium]
MGCFSRLTLFYPDDYQENVFLINYRKLAETGIKVLFIDLDNTLIPYDEKEPSAEHNTLFQKFKELGLSVVIISNNRHGRVVHFANLLGLPYIENARKPCRSGFKRAWALFPKMGKNEIMVIGDQVMTDVLGAKRMGFQVTLVNAIKRESERWYTRLNRKIEHLILRRIKQKDPDYYEQLNLKEKR